MTRPDLPPFEPFVLDPPYHLPVSALAAESGVRPGPVHDAVVAALSVLDCGCCYADGAGGDCDVMHRHDLCQHPCCPDWDHDGA